MKPRYTKSLMVELVYLQFNGLVLKVIIMQW